jgi:hypothetical protein
LVRPYRGERDNPESGRRQLALGARPDPEWRLFLIEELSHGGAT